MNRQAILVPAAELEQQKGFSAQVRALTHRSPTQPLAFVDTYGCQQNEADSERLSGMLAEMGYAFTDKESGADIILLNTCAVRAHAEQRVLGNVGALVHSKRAKLGQRIILCGCMMQEPHMAAKIKQSFRHVDLVFGPHALWRFPELLFRLLTQSGPIFDIEEGPGTIAEGLPVRRASHTRAWVSIMYGCNNFCSYCIVPYVRGRERSRDPQEILREVTELAAAGYKDITLLGQNVNSYGKDLGESIDFPLLLRRLNDLPGTFLLRFMTSHPKDASIPLLQAMADCEKVAPHLHLPFQAGNNRVLAAMNRGYTKEGYLEIARQARALMPELVLTSDVIVGFPGETADEFEDTLELLTAVRFDALFTFLYSPRVGTPAAQLPDPIPRAEKQANFDRLLAVQNEISAQKHRAYIGKTLRVLVDGPSEKQSDSLHARTAGGRLVHLSGDASLTGRFIDATITGASTWALFGTPCAQ